MPYFAKKVYANQPEFLASEKYQNFTTTVSDEDVVANADGRKIVVKGSLLDADGKVVTVSESGTPSATPVGILFDDVDVTYGPQPGALIVEAYITAERLPGENVAEYAKSAAFKTALPEIKVR